MKGNITMKTKNKINLLFLIISLLLTTTIILANDDNLIVNGDFSSTSIKKGNWTGPSANNFDNPWIPSNVSQSAKNSAKIEIENGQLLISSLERFRVAVVQTIVVDDSSQYQLSYDIKTIDLEGSGARIRIRSLDDAGKDINTDYIYTPYTNKTNTKTINQDLKFPVGTKKIKLEIFFENSYGIAYFDNLKLVKKAVENKPEIKFQPETGEINITTNSIYVPLINDCQYIIENPEFAELRNNLIYPLKAGETTINISKNNQLVSNFKLIIKEYNPTTFDKIREMWESVSLGNQAYDNNNPYMRSFLDKIENNVAQYLKLYDENDNEYIFTDITDYNKSANITKVYRRLQEFSQLLENKNSKYYQDYSLIYKLKIGMEKIYQATYNEQKEIIGNWWDYEIGTPRAILDILSYAHPYFTQTEIDKYIKPIDKFVPDPKTIRATTDNPVPAVGGNQTDLSKVAILSGALTYNQQRILDGVNGLKSILKFVNSGEGFYEDGSFIDHTDVAYTGAYGNVLIEGFSQLLPLIKNTEFDLKSSETSILYDWIENAYFPIILRGELMDMTRGRSISRSSGQSHVAAIEALRAIARIGNASDQEQKNDILSKVKGRIINDTFYDPYNNLKSYTDILLFNKLLNNNEIAPNMPNTFIKAFNNMDKFVYHNAQRDFSIAISMHSNKTQNYEDMNNENRHGWYSGDGMVYLYNNDLSHYSNNYWPTINPYLLPGTTTLTTLREDGSGQVNLLSSFVGATTLNDNLATVAMNFNNYNQKLTAKKAYFIFNDRIVFLTTNIQNQSHDDSITTIENRKLLNNKNYKILINNQDYTNDLSEKIKTIHISNDDNKQSIGYGILTNNDISVRRETRNGKWKDINYGQSEEIVTNDFITVTSKTKENGENLGYVLVPNQNQSKLEAVIKDIEIIEQTNDLQIVFDHSHQVYGIVKYNDQPYQLNKDLIINQAGMYVILKTANGYNLSFYNPNNSTNTNIVTVTSKNGTITKTKEASNRDQSTHYYISLQSQNVNPDISSINLDFKLKEINQTLPKTGSK